MPTMCLKVIVSWLLLTLNSAEFYIYCLRINGFKAWPILAPACFSSRGAENAASFTPLSHRTDGEMTSTVFLNSCCYKLSPLVISLKRSTASTLVFSTNAGNDTCKMSLSSLRRSFIELSTKCYVGQLFFCPDIKS